jgi:hypothetical protein
MTTDALRRVAALGLACASVAGFAACGSSDDTSSGSGGAAAAEPPSALAAGDAKALDTARTTIQKQCKDHAAVVGAVATLESLFEFDPEATDAKGTTVRAAVTDATAQLRDCDAAAAKRLAKLTR